MIRNTDKFSDAFRFQMLRDLIPNTDQKRDTASFLLEVCHEYGNEKYHICYLSRNLPFEKILLERFLEWNNVLLQVIEYVQFLQENVQKYEGTYQGWSSEPTKLIPWVCFLLNAFCLLGLNIYFCVCGLSS